MTLQFNFYPAVDTSLPNLYTDETVSSVIKYAKTQPPGVHRLQIQVYPPSFAVITVNESSQVSMHIVTGTKDDDYPENLDAATRVGYRWYNEAALQDEPRMSFDLFKRLHESICHKIDKSIEAHHGISCCIRFDSQTYEEGAFVLHFCDVLSIKLSEVQAIEKPQVIIGTPSFQTVPNDIVDSLFDDIMDQSESFTVEEKLFVIKNASLYYYIYGYWHNYSNKAIRCSLGGIRGLPKVSLLGSDDIFLRMQEAKHNQLSRRAQGDMVRSLYLLN